MSSIAVLMVGVLGVVYAASSTSGTGSASGAPAGPGGTFDARVLQIDTTVNDPALGDCDASNTATSFEFELTNVLAGFECTIEISITNDGTANMEVANIVNTFGANEGTYLLQDTSGCDATTPALNPIPPGGNRACTLVYTATQDIPDPLPAGDTDWTYTIEWREEL